MLSRRVWTLLGLLAGVACVLAAPDKEITSTATATTSTTTTATAATTPCVATHLTSGAMFDLRPDTAVAVKEGEKAHKGVPTEDYTWARPLEWPQNFTLNICAPVLKSIKNAVGVDSKLWANISAYYEGKDEKIYSLGQLNTTLVPRGTQLTLRYSGGSPCALSSKDRRRSIHGGASYKNYDDDERTTSAIDDEKEREKEKEKEKEKLKERRKSAIISFRCDRDPANTAAKLSFLEVDEDECTYVFSVLSQHACAKTDTHKPGSVGPGPVFGIIFFIAVLVYLVGGVFYQRTVAHARGWRQLPNYSLWNSIFNFFNDMLIILLSSCARCLPGSRRGYQALSRSPTGRGRNREDENRLIDQLDEEWDD